MAETTPTNFDEPWKKIITGLFPDFVEFFLPEIYPEIDFSAKYEFLEQELHKLIADRIKKGGRNNDKLVKVHLKDGTEKWILIHIEVQSYYGRNFSKRMFIYFYRIFDKYDEKITSLAVYTGDKIPKNYDKYEYSFFGTKNTYEFNTFLVRDMKETDLLKSKNPFALAVLASKYVNKTKNNLDERLLFKRKLIRLAKEKNYSDEKIVNILEFLIQVVSLSDDLEAKFTNEIYEEYLNQEVMLIADKSSIFAQRMFYLIHGETVEEHDARTEREKQELAKKIQMEAAEKFQQEKLEAAKKFQQEKLEAAKRLQQEKMEAAKKLQQEKMETAKKLLSESTFSIEKIADIANLSISEVKQLKKDFNK